MEYRWTHPTNAIIGVTSRCNYNCAYCFQGTKANIDVKLDNILVTLQYIVENRQELGYTDDQPSTIAFYGGEPLLQKKLIRNVLEAYPTEKYPYFYYCITTNGHLLDEEFIALCLEHQVRLIISYDGLFSTGPKSGSNTGREWLKYLGAIHYPYYSISVVVEEQNLSALSANIYDMANNLRCPMVTEISLDIKRITKELEDKYLKILWDIKEDIAAKGWPFIFLPCRPAYEKYNPCDCPGGMWPYFLHPNGEYTLGISTFAKDTTEYKKVFGSTANRQLDEQKLQNYLNMMVESERFCDDCDSTYSRCEQKIAGGRDYSICRKNYMFGASIPVMPLTRESHFITAKQYAPRLGHYREMPFDPVMMQIGTDQNTNNEERGEESDRL